MTRYLQAARALASALLVGGVLVALSACSPAQAPPTVEALPSSMTLKVAHIGQAGQIAQMHEACVMAMVKSTCQVMVGSSPADAATTVLIAGVGRLDAEAYRQLRAAGDAMCSIARSACNNAWDGASCRSARALWTLDAATLVGS